MNKIIQGNCVEVLKTLESESVDCCITSPPYWGLRDYGVEGQLGLEKTPEEYVAKMVEVFREVKRVLKKEGTLWLNLGDSYSGSGGAGNQFGQLDAGLSKYKQGDSGLKPKDLVGIPWRVAFALQADGWWLRQDIIWAKPNPMPESVTDRCTKSHEYIFLLAKSQKYYYDNEAIKEPVSAISLARAEYRWDCDRPSTKNKDGIHTEKMGTRFVNPDGRNKRSVWTITTKPYSEAHFATFPEELVIPMIKAGCPEFVCNKCGKAREIIKQAIGEKLDIEAGVVMNKSKPYAVVEREGYIEVRDLPPIAEIKNYLNSWRKNARYTIEQVENIMESQAPHHWFNGESYPTKEQWVEVKELFKFDDTYDFRMTDTTLKNAEKLKGEYKIILTDCGCNAVFSAGVVLDPFSGAGTTCMVAKKLGRSFIGIELNPEYIKMSEKRIERECGTLF